MERSLWKLLVKLFSKGCEPPFWILYCWHSDLKISLHLFIWKKKLPENVFCKSFSNEFKVGRLFFVFLVRSFFFLLFADVYFFLSLIEYIRREVILGKWTENFEKSNMFSFRILSLSPLSPENSLCTPSFYCLSTSYHSLSHSFFLHLFLYYHSLSLPSSISLFYFPFLHIFCGFVFVFKMKIF